MKSSPQQRSQQLWQLENWIIDKFISKVKFCWQDSVHSDLVPFFWLEFLDRLDKRHEMFTYKVSAKMMWKDAIFFINKNFWVWTECCHCLPAVHRAVWSEACSKWPVWPLPFARGFLFFSNTASAFSREMLNQKAQGPSTSCLLVCVKELNSRDRSNSTAVGYLSCMRPTVNRSRFNLRHHIWFPEPVRSDFWVKSRSNP